MKRLITALTVAVFAFPAGALAAPDAPHFPARGWDAPAPAEKTVLLAKSLPATGTDVAAPDQQSPIGDPVVAPEATGSDFDWGDAAVGAGIAICLAAISLGFAATFRRRRSIVVG